tara:strand:+ start:505 stop:684 length:180 start_codon:yes stop_codon:yes gene_type:complete
MEGVPVRSKVWYYYLDPEGVVPEILRVAIPITRKQALFILKKRLHIKKVYYIMICDDEG